MTTVSELWVNIFAFFAGAATIGLFGYFCIEITDASVHVMGWQRILTVLAMIFDFMIAMTYLANDARIRGYAFLALFAALIPVFFLIM